MKIVFQLSIFKANMLVSERVVPEDLPRLSKSVKCQSPFMVGFDIKNIQKLYFRGCWGYVR